MADENIARLKKRRGVIRTSVTKQIKSIETELKNDTLDSLEESLEILIEYANELESLDTELQKIIELKELDADINLSIEYKEKVIIWKSRARKKIIMISNSKANFIQSTDSNLKNSSSENVIQDKIQIKLPKLSIQKFNGEISQWLSFWNFFESAIHNNTSLDKISKFNYLKAHLSGTALHTVEGYAITDENYDNAIDNLQQRFGRPEILIDQHISNILAIPPLKHSSDIKTFRKLYDKILIETRSLETLHVLPDSYSTVLCPMLLKMLPTDLVFEFNKEVQNSRYEINKLIEFLSKQLIARERSSLSKNENPKSFSDRSQHFRFEEKRKTTEEKSENSNILLSLHASNINTADYWSLDTIGIRDPGTKMVKSELEKAEKDHFLQTITRDEEGRYSVSLPWIKDHSPLSDCEKSLERTERLTDNEKLFKDRLAEGIIEEVPPSHNTKNDHLEETARKLFNVYNSVLSVDTTEESSKFMSEAQALLRTEKFKLPGWEHTPPLILEDDCEVHKEVSVLGLNWKSPNDTLSIDVKGLSEDEELPSTKRKILSSDYPIFDPIDLTCPITLIPELIRKNGLSVDCALPEAQVKKFKRWKNELKDLHELEFPRYILGDSSWESDLSMDAFCDASKSAYTTSTFLRVADEIKVPSQLVQARSRKTIQRSRFGRVLKDPDKLNL